MCIKGHSCVIRRSITVEWKCVFKLKEVCLQRNSIFKSAYYDLPVTFDYLIISQPLFWPEVQSYNSNNTATANLFIQPEFVYHEWWLVPLLVLLYLTYHTACIIFFSGLLVYVPPVINKISTNKFVILCDLLAII